MCDTHCFHGSDTLYFNDLQAEKNKHCFGPYNELKKNLAIIAKELNVPVDDLRLIKECAISTDYMLERRLQDKIIKKIGMEGMPFISFHKAHSCTLDVGDGILILEARNNSDLQYAFFKTTYAGGYTYSVFIVPKEKVYRLQRHAAHMSEFLSEKHPPLLREGLLKDIVNNTVGFFAKKKELEEYSVKIRRGIVLSGEPGNGKTMVCRWIKKLCKRRGLAWGVISGGEIERYFSSGENLEKLFAQYPVTFYDDIDINYLNRKTGDGKIACAILSAMDGVFQANHIIRIFTTNEDLKDIDPAFIRPGRIDRCFVLEKPTHVLRQILVSERWPIEIVKYLTDTNQLEELLKISEGFSFAEMDAIKSLLVTNKIMGTGQWNLDRAFEEFYDGRETFSQKHKKNLGFSNNNIVCSNNEPRIHYSL